MLVHNAHSNSKSCNKFQYLYRIFNKETRITRKYGVTSTPPRANGNLPRPKSQLKPGEDYEVVDTAKNRTDILQKEKDIVQNFKNTNGYPPPGNILPRVK